MTKAKYFKNFILCGDLNYRCLLCQENFIKWEQVDRHLRWEKHRKALKTQNCLPQFSKDSIYKLDPYYYCSFCNRTMQDVAEIKQHIDSEIHKNYKTHPEAATARIEVKMIEDEIFIENTRISHFQWNGIIGNECVLCNMPVNSGSFRSHASTSEHVIHLIQARINYVDDKYYRKLNNIFQCFTCEKIFPIHIFDDHFTNHPKNPTEALKTVTGNTKTVTGDMMVKQDLPRFDKDGKEVKDCTMTENIRNGPMVLCGSGMDKIFKTEWKIELLADIKDDYFNIDMDTKKVTCKTCKKDMKIILTDISSHLYSHGLYSIRSSAVYKTISNYISDNYVQRNFDHGAARSKAAKYGKENYIKMNAGGSKAYCMLCDKFLSPSIDVFKSHTDGNFHKGHLELKGIEKPRKHIRGSYKQVYTMEVIKTLSYSADKKTFMINDEILMNEDSFFLMKRIEHGKYYKKTKCFACEETLLPENEKEHCISWKHKSNLLAAKTIFQAQLLIREIRLRLYHCGVCNESLPYWENLKKHLKSINHGIRCKEKVPDLVKKFGFSKTIVLKTSKDNVYMQLLNAVFNTKYVINFES